jgi:hypothetical protein
MRRHVACMGETRNTERVLVTIPKGKREFWKFGMSRRIQI